MTYKSSISNKIKILKKNPARDYYLWAASNEQSINVSFADKIKRTNTGSLQNLTQNTVIDLTLVI